MTHTRYRPELHVTAEHGIINAPAGALHEGGVWHLFHQYRRFPGGPARWAHSVRPSDPGAEWMPCDDVLAPEGEETDVRAGCAIEDNTTTRLYFTRVTAAGSTVHTATISDILATAEDIADDPEQVDRHVTRGPLVLGDQGDYTNMRSPWVVPDWRRDDHTAGWLMLVVAGPMDSPVVLVACSDGDPEKFRIQAPLQLGDGHGLPAGRMVSPKLIRLTDEVDGHPWDILLATVEVPEGKDVSGYLVGHLEGTAFSVARGFTPIDHGHDFTRPRATAVGKPVWGAADSEAIIFGLMNSVSRGDHPENDPSWDNEGWANCLSLARRATLQGGRLYLTPTTALVDSVLWSKAARAQTVMMDIPDGGSVTVRVRDTNGDTAAVVVHTGDTVTVDRSANPLHRGDQSAIAALDPTDTNALTVITDGSCLEVFADGGAVAMSSRLWSTHGFNGFTVTCDGGATITRSMEFSPRSFEAEGLDDLDDGSFTPDLLLPGGDLPDSQ
ncbi:GH32 C-terminal domain-containing protein [Corynebacterium mendelii]|uniref:beta-fructofuranosidase n=1 Tax=Corynebacterium mendelii TaxID=2765362 RepID=A0A939IY85_9CORY|nr:GH32 C-terminal domain-containing protein [Corynebacterium mendelii]MBN9644858.1 GH32 C-terminal domain-containing protein [Corynebacterium mendelii]